MSAMNLRFPPSPHSGTNVVEAENLSKSFGSLNVLQHIDFKIHRGDKVAFVGRNGEGKTTFSRIIIGELDYEGSLKIGHNVKIGYFAQNQDELLNGEKTVFETIDDIAKGDIRSKMRDLLAAFLFRGEEIDKKVKVLSGGERSRLALVRLLLEPHNLLVLDEPTNHLDIRSKDILKQALINYDGTLIVVSHDRDFLNCIVDKVYEFRHNRIKEHLGGIYDFLRKKKIDNLREIEKKDAGKKEMQLENISSNKLRYLEKKEYDRNLRKLRKKLEDSEKVIEKIENEISGLDKSFATGSNEQAEAEDFFKRYQELKELLNEEMEKWEQYTDEVEVFLKNNS
jgi:ATP-binding cassette subfamily F protein 3